MTSAGSVVSWERCVTPRSCATASGTGSTTLDAADREAGARLLEGLDARREQARDRLLSTFRATPYASLLDELVDAADEPRVLEEAASLPAASACRSMLDGPWKHVQAAAQQAKDDPTDASLHALRIRTKRIRYAAEAVAPVFGKRADGFAKAAAELQEVLGRASGLRGRGGVAARGRFR